MHGTDVEIPRLDPAEAERRLEAVLFASAEPVSATSLAGVVPGYDVRAVLDALAERYRGRGIVLRRIGDAYAFRTAPGLKFPPRMRVLPREERRKLSRAALETLTIVAARPGSTRAEIEELRGVADSAGTLDVLMDEGLVKLGPRKRAPGRPVTYLVTRTFLDRFGFADASELPLLDRMREAGVLGPVIPLPKGALAALARDDVPMPEEERPEADLDLGMGPRPDPE